MSDLHAIFFETYCQLFRITNYGLFSSKLLKKMVIDEASYLNPVIQSTNGCVNTIVSIRRKVLPIVQTNTSLN